MVGVMRDAIGASDSPKLLISCFMVMNCDLNHLCGAIIQCFSRFCAQAGGGHLGSVKVDGAKFWFENKLN